MTRRWAKLAGTLTATAVILAAWQPGTASGESRRRGGEIARSESRESSGGESAGVGRAIEAAERAGVARRDLRELTDLCARGGFSEEQTARIISLAAQMALEGLPVEGFAAKVGEGVSKRVDPDLIVRVAEKRALLLNQAKAIVNGVLLDGAPVRDREELIPDVAEALEAGREPNEARAILSEALQSGESIGSIRRKLLP